MANKKESNLPPLNAKKPPAPPAPPPKRIIKEDNYRWVSNFPTSKTKKRTTIKLEDDEVALVVDSDSNFSIYFPNMDDIDDDAAVPDHMQFMTAIAVVTTTDQEVIDLIWEKFHKLMEGVN